MRRKREQRVEDREQMSEIKGRVADRKIGQKLFVDEDENVRKMGLHAAQAVICSMYRDTQGGP
jgi:hypothetical protein